MLLVKKFQIQNGNFLESVQTAIQEAYDENGYPPNKIWVQPGTDFGNLPQVAMTLNGETVSIPVEVVEFLQVSFNLEPNQAVMEVNDPNNPNE